MSGIASTAGVSGGDQATVLDADAMRRAWTRIAHEILERNPEEVEVVLAGIPTRGVPLARRLATNLRNLGRQAEVLELAVDDHRDDRDPNNATQMSIGGTELAAVSVADRVVVLVDDVIFHGRTARAALDALTELGRPRAVQLAVLVDRGHRELPIRADYVGKNIPTRVSDRVHVRLTEVDGADAVILVSRVA
jgi:pyrimidine operon attenuation protein/uracil phosphoribosyltransferase